MEGSIPGLQVSPNQNTTNNNNSSDNKVTKKNNSNNESNIINSQPASNFARTPNPNQVLNQTSGNSPTLNPLPTTPKATDSTNPVNMPSHLQINIPSNFNTINTNKPTTNSNPLNTTQTSLNQASNASKQQSTDSKTKQEQQFQPMYGELKTPDYEGHLEKPDISDRVEIQSQNKKTNLPLIIVISLMILVGLASIIYTFFAYFKVKDNIDGNIIEILFNGIIPGIELESSDSQKSAAMGTVTDNRSE